MATRKDIIADTHTTAFILYCRACKEEFARVAIGQTLAMKAAGTFDADATRRIDEHLASCVGKAGGARGK